MGKVGRERGDTSAVTSLAELAKLEDERQRDVLRAVARRRDAEETERRDAARRLEEAERARRLAEEDRARAERERVEEERARHHAAERAAVERARLEVEGRARAEELELLRRHEVELARAKGDERAARSARAVVLLGVIAAAMAATGLGLYHGQIAPSHARTLAAKDDAIEHLRAELAARDRALAARDTELGAAKSELLRLRASAAPPPPRSVTLPPRATPGRGGRGGGPAPLPGLLSGDCPKTDPLCGSLPR